MHEFSSKPGEPARQGQRAHDIMVKLDVMTGRMGTMHVDEQHQPADQSKARQQRAPEQVRKISSAKEPFHRADT